MKVDARVVIALLILLSASIFAVGQTSSVDPTFNAVPSTPITYGPPSVVQPDGKVIIFGLKAVIDGVPTSDISRINADGTLDTSFVYCRCELTAVTNLALLPDGKIVVAGQHTSGSSRIIRLNADGSVDPTFVIVPPSSDYGFSIQAVQPDGKIFVLRSIRINFFGELRLLRYNANGTLDSSFSQIAINTGAGSGSVIVKPLPDGRFYFATNLVIANPVIANLYRYNADGSIDLTFERPGFTNSSGFPYGTTISDVAGAPDGSVFVIGNFAKVNALEKPNFVKLLSGGNVDTAFANPAMTGYQVHALPDGKILIGGNIVGLGAGIFRLNSNGSVDNTFSVDPAVQAILSPFTVDASLRLILFGKTSAAPVNLVRLLPTGALDTSSVVRIGEKGRVYATAVQQDGKVLVAGIFSEIGGLARATFARVNSDGSPDPTFDAHAAFDQRPEKLLLQPDGKILALGPFSTYDTVSVPGLVRINADGTRDATFNPTISSKPLGIALEADGQILISGNFNQVNGATRTGLARLNADGTLDTTFNPTIGASFGTPLINAVIAQADGKIVFVGRFFGVNGFSRTNLARLLSDGSTDPSFAPSDVSDGAHILLRQPDGKYLLAFNGFERPLVRYRDDGSRELGFVPPRFLSVSGFLEINAVAVQADGSIIVGGRFRLWDYDRSYLVRLSSMGLFEPWFLPNGADERVMTLSQYSPTKVIVGGDFGSVNNVMKAGIARLDLTPFRAATPFDFDGDGRADVAVYRPTTGIWYQLFSSGIPYGSPTFGQAGDVPAPADFDGDGKTDIAIFRPSTGTWWYIPSSINEIRAADLAHPADALPMPSDVNGDGKDDFVVYRPSERVWIWTTSGSSLRQVEQFGIAGDIPVIGDFDGDGKADRAIFRPSNGDWWYLASGAGVGHQRNFHWGQPGDIPTPADYDGDGKTDFAVFRPSDGGWYIFRSSDLQVITTAFGLAGDRPVAADYDGDGRADIAVFRPSNGIWYLNQSTSGTGGLQWGLATDVAIPNAFTPQ